MGTRSKASSWLLRRAGDTVVLSLGLRMSSMGGKRFAYAIRKTRTVWMQTPLRDLGDGCGLAAWRHAWVATLTVTMTTMIYLKALGVWGLFVGAGLVCRTIRDQLFLMYIGTQKAHQLSTLILCVLCALIIVRFVRWTGPTPTQALLIGLLWLLRTVIADVVFVHYVLGSSWSALGADYNLWRGRLGALVLVIQALSPYLFTKRAPCFS